MRKLAGSCVVAMALASGTSQAETAFTMLVGDPGFLAEAQAITKSINHENGLRIMPVIGEGSVQAARDLLDYPQIDTALVTADALAYAKAQNLLPPTAQRLAFIAAVKPLTIFVVARREFANVTSLAGKRIATGPADSASFAAGEMLLGGMEVPFLRVPQAQETAVDALLSGKADAALFVGVPLNLKSLGAGYHLLPLALPPSLNQTYQPAKLTAKDAPTLVPPNADFDTVSTKLILAVNSAWLQPRVKTFEQEFFRQTADDPSIAHDDVSGLLREATATAILKAEPKPVTIQPAGAQP